MEAAERTIVCCHDWRCPTSKPPYQFMGGISQGPPLPAGSDLGRGYLKLSDLPKSFRNKPCAHSGGK